VVTLLIGVLILGVAMSTAFTVLPLRIVDVGGTVTLVGAAMVVGAAAEVPLMHLSSSLARRFGPRPMVLLGGALFGTSLVLYGAVAAPLGLVLISAIRGAGYGLVYVGFVTWVGVLLPAGQQARGQAWLQTALLGVAPIAGASLGGLGYSHLAPVTLFSIAGVLALTGILVASTTMATATDRSLARPDR
jgi:MFS family permease